MQDLDYKDLFRDAIHTIAYIARAAGFDPNDPTVEPPAIIARVENQRANLDRLTAERAALLAPVEGADLEEVLRLDREGTAGPWDSNVSERRREGPTDFEGTGPTLRDYKDDEAARRRAHLDADLIAYYRTAAPALAREVARLRDHLNTARRLLPPRYVAADGSILDPERCTPHARDCAECGRGRAHDEECLGVLETPAEEVARLRAALEEVRLTLAAQRGRAEGAPPGWECRVITEDGDRCWRKPTADGMLFAWGAGVEFIGQEQTATPHPGGWTRWVADEDGDLDEQIEGHSDDDWTDRAAMLAADAATEAR